jgi:hypothetical protein
MKLDYHDEAADVLSGHYDLRYFRPVELIDRKVNKRMRGSGNRVR